MYKKKVTFNDNLAIAARNTGLHQHTSQQVQMPVALQACRASAQATIYFLPPRWSCSVISLLEQ